MKIFVGNVDDNTTQEQLSVLFEKYGTVVNCAIMKQFAFVHMRDEGRALAAINALNGRELNGRKMVVELSKPRPQNTWKVFVGNVSAACSAAELRTVFEAYGKVVECDIVKGKERDYAFIHMRDKSCALAAVAALNGCELNGRKILVELSKPRPRNTWKLFVSRVSAAFSASELRTVFEKYGRVVECDIIEDYAFVHMDKEDEAKNAIEHLNGKELKGRRINVELSTKTQKKGSGSNGQSGDRNRRSKREDSQTRSEEFELRRSLDRAYPQHAMTPTYDPRAYLDADRYDAYERQRSQSMYYGRDRSPMRRSPPLIGGYSMPTNALAAQYRAQSGVYGSQLASAYGAQASAALASAYGAQASAALAAAYGAQATYGTAASALEAAYGAQAGSSLANAYGTRSALASAYGAQASSLAAAYGAQAGGSNHYSSQSPGNASPYSSHASAALAASYRQGSTPLGTYDSASQLAALAQQSAAYSAMSQNTPVENSGFERTRLSPPRSSVLDAYRKSPELLKRLGSDRRLTESEYRRLAESQGAYRRSPSSELEYRRPAEPQSEYANYAAAYGDYLRAAQVQANYQRRL